MLKYVIFTLLALAILALRPVLLDIFQNRLIGDANANTGPCVVMLSSATEDQGGGAYIVGKIRNNCKNMVEKVTLQFRPKEEAESNTRGRDGLVYAYANKVESGETRAFKSTQPVRSNVIFHLDTMVVY